VFWLQLRQLRRPRAHLAASTGAAPQPTARPAGMNIWHHDAVMRELEKNGGKVPATVKD
jgi:hypothetical protein